VGPGDKGEKGVNILKIGIIINTSLYERVSYALSIGITYAAKGDEVYILFGNDGVRRLTKERVDHPEPCIDDEVSRDIKKGIEEGVVPKISEQIAEFRRMGGKIYVCPSSMAIHNIILNDLIEDVDRVIGLYEFIELLGHDSKIIYV